MARVRLPFPHPGQQQVREQAKRFNWLAAGRRWRKTTMVMGLAVEAALQKQRVIWGAPVFDQVRVGWDETKRAASGVADFNVSRMIATFPSGGAIIYRSLDNPDNVRGHTADGVIIDECADVHPDAWLEVLRPMLIDTDGWAWGIGTPKGRNWFWTEHQKALTVANTAAWQAPTLGVRMTPAGLVRAPHPLENPHIPFDEMVNLYQMMTERTFRQEIVGEFMETGGGVFPGVAACAAAQPQDGPIVGHEYVMGVDWGKLNDSTVLSVIDLTAMRQAYVRRLRQIDYTRQLEALRDVYDLFRPHVIIAERNSMGEPLIDQLVRSNYPVQPFTTTNETKAEIIEALQLAFQNKTLEILDDPVQLAELQAYEELKRTVNGRPVYGAPSGVHDDHVISLALAYSATRVPEVTVWHL